MAQRKRNRQGSLYSKVSSDAVLWAAWGKVAAGSRMPGVDGVTLPRFAETVHDQVSAIQSELRDGTFTFSPLRNFEQRKAGRSRVFSMPRVRDRLVHRAMLDVMGGRINKNSCDSSFAYRKGRSWLGALKRVEQARDRGERWVYRADVQGFFDSVRHDVLRRQVKETFADRRLADLLMSAIATPSVSASGFGARTLGLPLGLAISGALANLHLKPLDSALQGLPVTFVRYADDFVALSKSLECAEQARMTAECALRELGLQIQPQKSYVSSFERGFGYLGWVFFGDSGFQEEPTVGWTHPMEYR